MKKFSIGFLAAFFVLSMISCGTVEPTIDSATMNIANPNITFAPIEFENYTVLGRVSGSGSITLDTRTNTFTGDTLKYGSLGAISSVGDLNYRQAPGIFGFGTTTQTTIVTPASAREKAISNATYDMIEKAKAMGADAIIFVYTSVEISSDSRSRSTTTSVSISGTAVKLNTN